MKRLFFSLICLEMLFFGSFCPLGALEIELTGGLNSLTFHPDRITSHGQSVDYRQFKGYAFPYGDLFIKGDISEKIRYEANLQRDNIMLNCLSGELLTNLDYINIGFGPFAGMSDKMEKPDLGITGFIELALPGIVFLSISGTSTLGSGLEFMGNNKREIAEVTLGFWLPYFIASASVNIKNFTRRPEDTLVLRDDLKRFQLSVDFYTKNFPLILCFDAGYEILSRSYKWGNTETIDELGAVFFGFEASWQVKQLRIIGGYEMPIRLNAVKPMENPDDLYNLYKFKAGVSYTFY